MHSWGCEIIGVVDIIVVVDVIVVVGGGESSMQTIVHCAPVLPKVSSDRNCTFKFPSVCTLGAFDKQYLKYNNKKIQK